MSAHRAYTQITVERTLPNQTIGSRIAILFIENSPQNATELHRNEKQPIGF